MNDAEAAHIAFVASVFETYSENTLRANKKRKKDYDSLPLGSRALLPDYPALLAEIDDRIAKNAKLLRLFAADASAFLQPSHAVNGADDSMQSEPQLKEPTDGDYERVRSILRQVVREWAADGQPERDASYGHLLARLDRFYEEERGTSKREELQVLVPGAGLGRLVWEVADRGFQAVGNECSMYMLLAGNAILNDSKRDQHECYPFIHSLSNVVAKSDILSPVHFPDVDPSRFREGSKGSMSMAAGDFVDVYQRPEYEGAFDVIMTAFFIDTASNLVLYLDTIRHALSDDGVWLNQGPLLWHFESSNEQTSLELTLEDVKALCRRMGFILEEETFHESRYTGNSRSMLRYHYQSAFWVARKAPATP